MQDLLALTHPQKRVWYVEQLYPGTPLHNLAGTATFAGGLDFSRLEAAFNLLVRTHDATRIRIIEPGDREAQQYVAEFRPFAVPVIDFAGDATAFASWRDAEARRPFVLARDELFRVKFFRLSPEACGYFVCGHHIAADGWSFQLLTDFVGRAYRDPATVPSEVPSYFELAAHEAAYAGSEPFHRARQFWLDELRGAPTRPVEHGDSRGEQLRVRVASGAADRVRRFAADAGVSVSTLYTALLCRHLRARADRDDVVIGLPIVNRSGRLRRAFGMFASTMPLRVQLAGDEPLGSLARRVHAAMRRGLRHQRYPYDLVLRDLGGGSGGLFAACMNSYNTDPATAARIDDRAVSVDECYVGHQLFPLYVIAKEWSADATIALDINYKPAAYTRHEIDELAAALIAAAPETPRAAGMTIGGGACARPLDELRFPGTRITGAPAGRDSLAFELGARLDRFGGDRDSALVAAVCLLLARCCARTDVVVGVAVDGAPAGLRCSATPELEFRAVMSDVARSLRGARGESAAHGVVVDLRGSAGGHAASIVIGPGAVAYDAALYDRADIELLVARLRHVLDAAARDPAVRVGELEVVGAAERELLLVDFNRTAASFPSEVTIVQQFEATARRVPDAVALRWGRERWSYARLNQRANQLARTLRDRGVGRGALVPVMVARSPELLVGVLGVLKAGAAYVPIDPSYPRARIELILEESGAPFVIGAPGAPGREVIALDDERSYAQDGSELAPVASPTDLAYVCYTSGSTGTPKGAMIEHGSLVNRLHWMQRAYPLTASDVLLQKTSISFDVSIWELLWWTMSGASLSLAAPGDEKHPDRLVESIERDRVTVIHFVPSMLQAFLSYVEHGVEPGRLRSLRQVFASGEALRPAHVDAFERVFAGTGTRLTNLYGPTEATIDVTYHDCPRGEPCARVPIGRPIDNTRLRILGANGELQPVGVPGELHIGGVGVARGYWNRPELTDQRFVPDPYHRGERLYRTGDLARWLPDGSVEFLGRNDDQVKVRGHRIELGDIEAALRRHAAVADAAVVMRRQLCAYVVLRAPCELEQLRAHLAAQLPDYMVPGVLQQIDALPIGPTGKLDRAALPEPTCAGAGELAQTPEERLLAEIWQEVLDRPAVHRDDNFFALGGDSIKVIALVAKAKARGRPLTTQDVYRHPNIRELARALEGRDAACAPTSHAAFDLVQAEDRARLPPSAEDAFPLSALQAGLIFEAQIHRATPYYHDVFSYRINGVFDADKFRAALRGLASAYGIFRTTFHLGGFSEPIQIVHRSAPEQLVISDLRGVSRDAQERAIERDIAAIRAKAFDWEQPTLIGFHVHLLSESQYLYTIDFHDSALDGWSVNLIHRTLFETYYALLADRPLVSDAPATGLRELVALERRAIADPAHRAYWEAALDGSSFLKLPRCPRRGDAHATGVSFHEVALAPGLSDAIRQVADRLGVPLKSVLLAAHVHVLALLTGELDVVTGYEYGVRPEGDNAERAIGLFLNTLPLRVQARASTWRELVQRVYDAETELVAYRRYPMAQIKRDRGVRGLLFEHVFNFTHFHVLGALKQLPGFALTEVKVRAETEFVLRAECSVHPFTDEVLLWIHYHADVFPPEQIAAIGGYYARALEALTRDPLAAPAGESLLGDDERRRQLVEFNANARPIPQGRCFHHLFEDQAARAPARIAASCGAEQWSYGELDRAANQLAHAIARRTAGAQAVVAIAMRRDLVWMAATLACWKAGCAYLPLDLDHPVARIREILARAGCSVVITGDAALELPGVEVVHAGDVLRDEQRADRPDLAVSPSDLAYVIFTSGSTGAPKGAMVEHAGMLNHLLAKVGDLGLAADDVIAQNASQCFDISVWQLFAAALVGARVAIVPSDQVADVHAFLATLRREQVSILEVVPSYLSVMLELLERSPELLRAPRYLLVTGEPAPAKLIQRWFTAYPEVPVVNAYGPTEASDDICHHVMTAAPDDGIVPVGTPIQNLNVYVLDDRLQLVPIGTSGEVCVSGVGVGRGYIHDRERTEAAFVRDPFRPAERMYRTGDIGRWTPDGVLVLAGRKDEQIKLRGYRIEIGEIESRIQRYPGVAQAAVVADPRSATLVAFVSARHALDVRELRRELASQLPDYMVPARIAVVDELALTANGKIAKQKLLDGLAPEDPVAAAPPLTATASELRQLWAGVLAVDPSQITGHSDFFALGGHSLKAMELALRASGRFSINDVFKYPVLEDLARRIEHLAASGEGDELLVDYSRERSAATLSFIGFSYAGGSAASFKPMFDALSARRRDLACYAIEVPRRASSWLDVEAMARACVEQIHRMVHTPVVLWGHCSGSALALEVARLLEASATEVRLVIMGGKVVRSSLAARARSLASRAMSPFIPVDAMTMSAAQIQRWLIDKTGFDGFHGLSQRDADHVVEAFRHDAAGAARYFDRAYDSARAPLLATPILNIVAEDDLLTRGYRKKLRNWQRFSNRVELCVLDSGGHYFIKTRAQETADLVLRRIGL